MRSFSSLPMLSNKALSIKGFVGHIFMRSPAAHAVRDQDVAGGNGTVVCRCRFSQFFQVVLPSCPHLLRLLEQGAADFAVPFPLPCPVASLECVMGGRSRRIRKRTLAIARRGTQQIRGIHVDGAITILIILEYGGIQPVSQFFL